MRPHQKFSGKFANALAVETFYQNTYLIEDNIRKELQKLSTVHKDDDVTATEYVQQRFLQKLNAAMEEHQKELKTSLQQDAQANRGNTTADAINTCLEENSANPDRARNTAVELRLQENRPAMLEKLVHYLHVKLWNETIEQLQQPSGTAEQTIAKATEKFKENLQTLANSLNDNPMLKQKLLQATDLVNVDRAFNLHLQVAKDMDQNGPRAALEQEIKTLQDKINNQLAYLSTQLSASNPIQQQEWASNEISLLLKQKEALQTALNNMPKNPTADFKETRGAVNNAFAALALYDYRIRIAAKCDKLFEELRVEATKQAKALSLMQQDLQKATGELAIATPENKPALDKKVKDLTASIAQYDAPKTRAETLTAMKQDLQTRQAEYDASTNEEKQRALADQITELKQKIAGYGETIIQGDEQRKEQQKKMAADLYPKVTDSSQDLNKKTKWVDRLLAQKFPSEFNHVYAELSKKPVAFKPGQMEALSKILETSKDAKPLIAPTIKAIQDCNNALAKIDELSRRTTSAHAMGTYAEEYKTAVHAAEKQMAEVARRLNDSSVQPALTFAAKNAGKDETERKDNERKFNELMGALEATQAKLLEATLMLHKRLPKEKIPKTGWLSLTDQIKEKLGLIQCEPTTGRGVVTYQELNKETGQLETKYPKDKEGNNLDLSYIEAAQAVQKYNEKHKDEPGFKRATIDPPRKDGRWTTHSNSKNKVTGTMELMNIMTEIQNARPKDEKKQTDTASVTASNVGKTMKTGPATGAPVNSVHEPTASQTISPTTIAAP